MCVGGWLALGCSASHQSTRSRARSAFNDGVETKQERSPEIPRGGLVEGELPVPLSFANLGTDFPTVLKRNAEGHTSRSRGFRCVRVRKECQRLRIKDHPFSSSEQTLLLETLALICFRGRRNPAQIAGVEKGDLLPVCSLVGTSVSGSFILSS